MENNNYTADNGGKRYDDGKTQFHLLPSDGLSELAKVYMAGASKYAPYNWERGMAWSRCYNSLLRHLYAYWDGERNDKESGLHHMAHATWNALALLVYSIRGIGIDDRKTATIAAQESISTSITGLLGQPLSEPRYFSAQTWDPVEIAPGGVMEIKEGLEFLTEIGTGPVWKITKMAGKRHFEAESEYGKQMMTLRSIKQLVKRKDDPLPIKLKSNLKCIHCPNTAMHNKDVCAACFAPIDPPVKCQ